MTSFTLLNTRPVGQAQSLNKLLVTQGGQGVSCPSMQIVPLEQPCYEGNHLSEGAPRFEVKQLLQVEHWVFISVNAVQAFADHLNAIESQAFNQVLLGAQSLQVHAIGRATSKALQDLGFSSQEPLQAQYDSESLLRRAEFQSLCDARVLIFKGLGGRETLASELKVRGAQVGAWSLYERQMAPWCHDIWQQFKSQPCPMLLFSSLGSFENFKHQLNATESFSDWQWAVQQPAIVFSQRIVDFCRQAGWQGMIEVVPLQSDMGILQAIDVIFEHQAS